MNDLTLHVTGMTCASCAARIQKKVGALDGVDATVNYATEKLHLASADVLDLDAVAAAVRKAGYDVVEPAAEDAPETPPRFPWVGVVLAAAVMVVSMVPLLQFTGWQWASWGAALFVVLWCGRQFHLNAARLLRSGETSMDTLISMGTLTALGWSTWVLFTTDAGRLGMTTHMGWPPRQGDLLGELHLGAACAITGFLLIGRHLEHRARRSATAALRDVLAVGAKEAVVVRAEADGSSSEVRRPVAALTVGDRVVVRAGEKIPADGLVREGTAGVDVSLITGESVPVGVGPGSVVSGGALNTDGRLVVELTAVGTDTELARIAAIVEQAQTRKAGVQRLADRVSAVFVPAVIGIAVLTFAVWLLLGATLNVAVGVAVAVLIVACPCALGLATPMAMLVGTGRAAAHGVAVSGPEALESSAAIRTIVLDKTGTLTTGGMTVGQVHTHGMPAGIVKRLAAAVESVSAHPLARAIAAAAPPVPAEDVREVPGHGVTGTVEGHTVVVGSPTFVEQRLGIVGVPVGWRQQLDQIEASGATAVAVGVDQALRGLMAVGDTVSDSAAPTVSALRELGLAPILLTGDHERAARAVAARLGIDDVRAGVRPEQKADTVAALRGEGAKVAMVGDGVNDAGALASADLGIAMGTGADAAMRAADMTLLGGQLELLPGAIRLARATRATIRQNLWWAFGYNIVGIPLAAVGFLPPMLAGGFMAFSSLAVVGNSLRLRSVHL